MSALPNLQDRAVGDKQVSHEKLNMRPTKGSSAAILVLKQRHNALSIAFRLPMEILSEIFQYVAAHSIKRASIWNRGCVAVSYVCAHWRSVALGCPALWTNIHLLHTSPKWAAELFERSKSATLAISAGAQHISTPIFQTVIDNTPRIGVLSIEGYSGSLRDALHRLTQPASHLEVLIVKFDSISEGNKFPPQIFSRITPRLRELEVNNCSLDWDSHLFSDLTSLKLKNFPPNARPSVGQWLNVLRSMPKLEILSLLTVFSTISEGPTLPPVHLNHLRYLFLDSNIINSADFLKGIEFSSTTTVNIRCPKAHARSEQHPLSIGFMHIQNLGFSLNKGQLLRQLQVGETQDYQVELKAWDCLDNDGTEPRIDILMSLKRIIPSRSSDHLVSATKRLWMDLPLEHLEYFRIDYDSSHYPDRVWTSGLGHLKSLRRISVADYGQGFLDAISMKPANILSFAGLRCVVMEGWVFSEIPGKRHTSLEQLKHCLVARRQAGKELTELQIHNCKGVKAAEVAELAQLVQDVTWDGNAGSDDEEDRTSGQGEDDEEPDETMSSPDSTD